MKRIAFALIVLLAAAVLLPSFAESGPRRSTPTDLCPHEHTETVYYFDSPVYYALDKRTHRVTGRATVEMRCRDCEAVLSITVEENAEEIKEHVFRQGKCVLCGWEDEPASVVQEIVHDLSAVEGNAGLFRAVFTVHDLENAGDILVLRTVAGGAAVVLQSRRIAEQMNNRETLTAEILVTSGRAANISVRIAAEDGQVYVPDIALVSLRFYSARGADSVIVTRTDARGVAIGLQAAWVEGGNGGYYRLTPYPGDGSYAY